MAKINYSFDKANLVKGLSVMARYAIEDYDEAKQPVVYPDMNVFEFDATYALSSLPGCEIKFRSGFADAEDSKLGQNASYNEYRLELNYLF